MTDRSKYALLIGTTVFILLNSVYDLLNELMYIQIKGLWYFGNAFAWLCFGYYVNFKEKNTILSMVILSLVFSNLLDEIVGSPKHPDIIEYVSFVAILLFCYGAKNKDKIKLIIKKIKVWIYYGCW